MKKEMKELCQMECEFIVAIDEARATDNFFEKAKRADVAMEKMKDIVKRLCMEVRQLKQGK